MFEFWNKLSPMKKILLIIAIILVVIVVVVFVIVKFRKSKEGYTTASNKNTLLVTGSTTKSNSSDPLSSYVEGWINSVRELYSSTKSINEPYAESRTMKNFNAYTYLDKNPLVTGINKY
jgi:uncharacterized protein YpmS